jgi:hypothetical protein
MQKRLIAFIFAAFLVCMGALMQGCLQFRDNKHLQAEYIIQQALDTLPLPQGKDRLFIISQSACSACFDKAIETIAQSKLRDNCCIIVIGADAGFVYHLNFTHRRSGLKFLPAHMSLYEQLARLHPSLAESLIMGAIKKNKDITMYNGLLHLDTQRSMQPDSVLNFLLNN